MYLQLVIPLYLNILDSELYNKNKHENEKVIYSDAPFSGSALESTI